MGYAQLFQDLMAGRAQNRGARVVVLVDAVAEAHELEGVSLVLGAIDELRDARLGADLREHLEHCFIGATMRRTP